MKLRIGTFNAENLFARFRFKGVREAYTKPDGSTGYRYRDYTPEELNNIAREGWAVDKTRFEGLEPESREITALAIRAIKADVLGLQEIEAMDTLKRFVGGYLEKEGFAYKVLIDGNDPRLIDVALLINKKRHDLQIAYIQTHQFDRTADNKSYVFSRDCLEVGVRLSQNTVLPVFVNHFKSMMDGREETMARRRVQSQRVVEILKHRFGSKPGKSAWVVLGDLNDYMPSEGLEPLLGQPWLENVLNRLPEKDRWTHYYKGEDEYRQLDYILLSRSLATANPSAVPYVERRGLPLRARQFTGERFPGVGQNAPKASDHCPVVMEVEV
jgi:predicted extracellular nuclease